MVQLSIVHYLALHIAVSYVFQPFKDPWKNSHTLALVILAIHVAPALQLFLLYCVSWMPVPRAFQRALVASLLTYRLIHPDATTVDTLALFVCDFCIISAYDCDFAGMYAWTAQRATAAFLFPVLRGNVYFVVALLVGDIVIGMFDKTKRPQIE